MCKVYKPGTYGESTHKSDIKSIRENHLLRTQKPHKFAEELGREAERGCAASMVGMIGPARLISARPEN
jgi:hypothetical protein